MKMTTDLQIIEKYFPNLTEVQKAQLKELKPLYEEWNAQINVISRKDIEQLYERHVLHSLSIAKLITFKSGSQLMDLGCGGGFPGIPLAILFPEVSFTLIDSIGKKIKVVQEVADALGLKNVQAHHMRAEKVKDRFDFVITRAVAVLPKLMHWTQKLYKKKQQHGIPNGLWALKGTDRAAAEVQELGAKAYAEIYPLSDIFEAPFFETKCVVYVQA